MIEQIEESIKVFRWRQMFDGQGAVADILDEMLGEMKSMEDRIFDLKMEIKEKSYYEES